MSGELIAAWVTIGLMLISGIWAMIKMSAKNAENHTIVTKDIEYLKKDFLEHITKNNGQHEELFNSRNDMRDLLTRLTILSENFDKRQDGMDKKIDLLLERRAIER